MLRCPWSHPQVDFDTLPGKLLLSLVAKTAPRSREDLDPACYTINFIADLEQPPEETSLQTCESNPYLLNPFIRDFPQL